MMRSGSAETPLAIHFREKTNVSSTKGIIAYRRCRPGRRWTGKLRARGRTRGIGFASLVSVGNDADLSVGTVGQTLVDDRQTEVFILFLESLKHAPDLELSHMYVDNAAMQLARNPNQFDVTEVADFFARRVVVRDTG